MTLIIYQMINFHVRKREIKDVQEFFIKGNFCKVIFVQGGTQTYSKIYQVRTKDYPEKTIINDDEF